MRVVVCFSEIGVLLGLLGYLVGSVGLVKTLVVRKVENIQVEGIGALVLEPAVVCGVTVFTWIVEMVTVTVALADDITLLPELVSKV